MASDLLDKFLKDMEEVSKNWQIDSDNINRVNIDNFMIVYALTSGPESPSSVEDFYERPFHEKMSLFSKKNYYS